MTDIDKVIEIDREMRPELYQKIDDIALIISPESFTKAQVSGFDDDEVRRMNTRHAYMQSIARNKAFEILKYMGFDTQTDWAVLLRELVKRDEDAEPTITRGD